MVGAIFFNAKFTAPWCYQSPRADAAAPLLAPGAERVVIFHLITEGECYAELDSQQPMHLVAGDATSRSVLAERFQRLVGSSPMQYLTQWRMLLASNLLRGGNTPMARIAEAVGYQTDAAFSRAFRREFGSPPATWRRTQPARSHA
jgi:hypothetical protein